MGKATSLQPVDPLLPACLLLCVLIAAADWAVPAGIVVGMLLTVPIVMASGSSRTSDVWLVLAVALVLKIMAAIFGRGPITPAAVWVPNRLIAIASLPAAALIASRLQQRRLEAERARDVALESSELSRLLFALLAHDLRSPLQLSRQSFDYIQQVAASGGTPDPGLLSDLRVRIDRNLRTVDAVLAAARADIAAEEGQPQAVARGSITAEIEQEVRSFDGEAELRGKRLVTDIEGVREVAGIDALMLRGVLSIVLDNAIRYADRGDIRVLARCTESELTLRVEDPGPGIQPGTRGASEASAETGVGLGLHLCELLVRNAGGGLRIGQTDAGGGCVEAWLPLAPAVTTSP